MFSPNKVNSPLGSSFQEPVFQNQKQIKGIQNKYFNDEYQKSINLKLEKQQQQKLRKRQQSQFLNRKNQQYLNSIAIGRYNKLQQKQYMAQQYQQMINNRKMREKDQKLQQKYFEKDILGQRTWIRDQNQERQANKMKINRYNQELQMHVRAQQQRIKQQQERQKQLRQKINEQAQQIINKEIYELQERQRKKLLFEQRQNQLLGSYHAPRQIEASMTGMSNSRVMQEINLRKKQQQAYGLGLQLQRQTQQQRKRKQPQIGYSPGQSYNPITNPIPVVYKNPNVLRMLSQK